MSTTSTRRAGLLGAAALLLGSILPALGPGPALAHHAPAPVADGGSPTSTGWRVESLGAGRYAVAWTSPRRLPTTSDRPTLTGAGLVFGPSTVEPDGRTVRAVVTSATRPDVAALDVMLSGDRLDEPGDDARSGARGVGGARADDPTPSTPTRVPTHLLAAPDPGTRGAFATVTSDYTLPSLAVPGLPTPVEMVGHVVEPAPDAATGPRPLVLFLHGRHATCFEPGHPRAYTDVWPCPAPFEEVRSDLGYTYLQDLLASQGYATVSVRVNGVNAQDDRLTDGGAAARAQVVRAHLDHWVGIAAAHQVDLDQVVLVGHSRGGEGVARASVQVPLGAPYRVAGQVLIAPVDFAGDSSPYVPTVTLLPYCDGDVYDLQGQQYTDTGRDLDPADTALHSSVLVMGADHNFFNTEWTPGASTAPADDDWGGDPQQPCGSATPERLRPDQQRSVAQAYVAGAVDLFTGDQRYLPLFDGSHVTVPSVGDADVRSAAVGGGRTLRRPGVDASPTAPTGGARNELCAGISSYDVGDFGRCGRGLARLITPDWSLEGEGRPVRQLLEMAWTQAGATGGLRFDRPLDLSGSRLDLRTIVDPGHGDVRLRVQVTDGAGHQAVLTPEGGETVPALLAAPGLTKLWAQDVVVDPQAAIGVDLTDVTAVGLVADSSRGRVWVADVAAAPATLPAVPATRLPRLEVGSVSVPEGDTGGQHVVRVPFHLEGTPTQPARFVVVTTGEAVGARHRFTIDVAPGQTDGTIPVSYVSNRLDDLDEPTTVEVWPLSGLVGDDHLGRARVLDDDATPALHVTAESPLLHEGDVATVHLALDRPVDYDTYAFGEVVKGHGEPLRGNDVPLAWLTKHADTSRPTRPLYRLFPYVSAQIPARSRTADITVPVAVDDRAEGPETLTLRLHVGRTRVLQRFVVAASS